MKQEQVLSNRQNGAALVAGLVLLLIMTLIGLAAMRTTTMQERMSGAVLDQNRAFQAAEAALRAGERALAVPNLPEFSGNGWYEYEANGIPDWDTYGAGPSADGVHELRDVSIRGVARPPQYYIERLPPITVTEDPGGSLALGDGTALEEIDVYRVVARGFGGNEGTTVVIESVYRR